MQRLETRVFELAAEAGYASDPDLARAMGIPRSSLWRVKKGIYRPTHDFIAGALRAFPGKTFEDLFYVVETSEDVTEDKALAVS